MNIEDTIIQNRMIKEIRKKQKEKIIKAIWRGTNKWAEKAWKCNWLNKKEWYDDTELSSSIANHIIRELKQ